VTVSSGEIFTGALQDLDRAVVIGERTFGKGFVQGTRYPGFGTSVYLTVARYYTPSGRCIQELDYSKKLKENRVVKLPDSLKHEYKTAHGRKVFNIGGIDPDIKQAQASTSALMNGIRNSTVYFDLLTEYRNTHEQEIVENTFTVSQAVVNDVIERIINSGTLQTIKLPTETEFENFKATVSSSKLVSLKKELNSIERKLQSYKVQELRREKAAFKEMLEKDLVRRYKNQSGSFRYTLAKDPQIRNAVDLLHNEMELKKLLNLN
jgi:carboxyl-terminal processing protease